MRAELEKMIEQAREVQPELTRIANASGAPRIGPRAAPSSVAKGSREFRDPQPEVKRAAKPRRRFVPAKDPGTLLRENWLRLASGAGFALAVGLILAQLLTSR